MTVRPSNQNQIICICIACIYIYVYLSINHHLSQGTLHVKREQALRRQWEGKTEYLKGRNLKQILTLN